MRALTHDTTLPTHVRHGLPSPPGESLDPGPNTGRLIVDVDGQGFRVRTARCGTQWLPDTPSNRHLTLVWCRWRVETPGKPLCTVQEFATSVGSTHRQAASQHLEDVRQCGADRRAFVLRQRNVDAAVVAGVWHALLQTPLAGPTALVPRVQARWSRQDLTVAKMECALEPISGVPVLRTLRRQWEPGTIQDQAAALVAEILERLSPPGAQPAGAGGPSGERGMRIADPTALAALVTPDLPLAQVPGSRCWLTFLMTLFAWHVPVSVLGRWCGVHQTTIFRWVLGLARAWWPFICPWMGARVNAAMVSVDETWRKIRGRWHEWFVVLDGPTALPVLAALLPSRGQWACRWSGAQLRQRKKVPTGLITDG